MRRQNRASERRTQIQMNKALYERVDEASRDEQLRSEMGRQPPDGQTAENTEEDDF